MEIAEEITAYVDNEVKDLPVKYRMWELINHNFPIRNEYLIQKKIKELLQQRFANGIVPDKLKSKILTGIFQKKID